jgi:hypothetical protein
MSRMARTRMRFAIVGVIAASALVPASSARAGTEPEQVDVTVLAVQAPTPPRALRGTDGRTHLDYNLIVTNVFPEEVTLSSVEVRADGDTILRLEGSELAAHTTGALGGSQSAVIPASGSKVIQIDASLPGTALRELPRRVGNHITFALAPNSPLAVFAGSDTVHGPRLEVDPDVTVIEPPIRGPGWFAANACCDPGAPHRATLFSFNGDWKAIEMFAVDWIRVVGDTFFTGDGSQLTDYFGFGEKIHAAADGRVVSVRENRPEAPLNLSQFGNPTVTEPSHLAGNHAVIKIGPGRYAAYAHMQPGSIRVKPGDEVRAGEVIGLLGNTGNSTAPHLHFGIQDAPNMLGSNGLPFVIDRLHFAGSADFPGDPPTLTLTGSPADMRNAYPLVTALTDFAP